MTLSVEKAWLESEGAHKWSIQLNQFDEAEDAWVALPSKRRREDDERVYYTAVLPHFSDIVITGSTELPEPVFSAHDLVITPPSADADEEVLISARITNTSQAKAVFPASLWINDTVEAVQSIPIGAGETALVEFSTTRPEGLYKVRIDRLLGDLTVGQAPPPSPTPTMTAVPTSRPSPAPTQEAEVVAVAVAVAVAHTRGSAWERSIRGWDCGCGGRGPDRRLTHRGRSIRALPSQTGAEHIRLTPSTPPPIAPARAPIPSGTPLRVN